MGNKPLIQIRDTIESDGDYIKKWLLQPGVLAGFPMCDLREIEDSTRIWMEFAKKGCSITALYKKKVCGCANLYIQTIEKLKHQSLFVIIVDEAYRGQGIGTLLIKTLMKRAKEKFSIELLHLEVYQGNPAISLYKRLGFTQYGSHPRFLKDAEGKYYDKILM
ncbi:MAG: GNAT family N-acetyltransferase, partial [Simkania negevensis]|nr:GNAT family N-acetyltransferase [Simkania negevensis]